MIRGHLKIKPNFSVFEFGVISDLIKLHYKFLTSKQFIMSFFKFRIILVCIAGIVTIGFSFLILKNLNKEKNSFSVTTSQKIVIELNKLNEIKYELNAFTFRKDSLINISRWPLDYEVFRFDNGDVNRDGTTDILIGVIKPTRFDSICRKRLFIFKLIDGNIRPLWLGSRVSQPLIDFKFHSENTGIIRTIELERNNTYLVAEYSWKGFGLDFKRYLAREVPIRKAQRILNKKNHETI